MRVFSVWLGPMGQHAESYTQVISTLSGELGTPAFLPHLTIGSTETKVDLEVLAAGVSPIVATPVSLQTEPVFTRSLVVQFELSLHLKALRSRLETLPGFKSKRPFDPHISLCYGTPPSGVASRPEIAELLRHPVRFDTLRLIELSLPVETHDDVRNWREVASVSLM